MEGRRVSADRSVGPIVFLPKVAEAVLGGFAAPTETDTRPLTLGNTARKLVAKLQNLSLADVAASIVSEF